jgi:hypothetical protein
VVIVRYADNSVVGGWLRYYAVPLTWGIPVAFGRHVARLWLQSLRVGSKARAL